MRFTQKLLVAGATLSLSVPAFAQNLTSVVLHNTSLARSWNTRGGDSNPSSFNLYLSTNDGASFINTGNGAGASVNIPLVDGDNTFFFFGTANVDAILAIEFGISTTDSSNPTISASTSAGAASTAFSAYSGQALRNDLTTTVGSGSLSSGLFGVKTVTLTSFSYKQNSPNRDLVNLYQTGADGINDTYGSFTLRLAQVAPEPGTLGLLGLGMIAGLAIRRRK
jgi:PEP-CTERM motif